MGNIIEEIAAGLDMWAEERAEERSLTWKERHANGVPVKMNQFQFYNRIRELPDGDSTEWVTLKNGSPESGQSKDGIEIRFCNFRYKPEWLDKHKKQTI